MTLTTDGKERRYLKCDICGLLMGFIFTDLQLEKDDKIICRSLGIISVIPQILSISMHISNYNPITVTVAATA